MILQIPNQVFLSTTNKRLFYQAEGLATGKDVKVQIYTPNLKEVPIVILTELKYGLYYFEFKFEEVGDYVGTFFEDDKATGSAIFRVSF